MFSQLDFNMCNSQNDNSEMIGWMTTFARDSTHIRLRSNLSSFNDCSVPCSQSRDTDTDSNLKCKYVLSPSTVYCSVQDQVQDHYAHTAEEWAICVPKKWHHSHFDPSQLMFAVTVNVYFYYYFFLSTSDRCSVSQRAGRRLLMTSQRWRSPPSLDQTRQLFFAQHWRLWWTTGTTETDSNIWLFESREEKKNENKIYFNRKPHVLSSLFDQGFEKKCQKIHPPSPTSPITPTPRYPSMTWC